MSKPLFSIITGTYNRIDLLQAMMDSVRNDIPDGMPYEFIICDGGSTDGTIEWLKAQPNVVLIEHGELKGAIEAFTDAGKLARGKYTLILNDDIQILYGTTLKALIHLEENPNCGMVAFEDDRASAYHPPGQFHTLLQAGRKLGADVGIIYGQCCMVRTWLGVRNNWWRGLPEQAFTARTYAGDNMLSSNLWAMGYSVDAVAGCRVHDTVVDDGLRRFNNTEGRGEADSADYYRIWPVGPEVLDSPIIPQVNTRQMRVLLLTLYEQGFGHYKSGLRDALAKYFIVFEFDYLFSGDLAYDLGRVMELFQPDLVLMQAHDTQAITPKLVSSLRSYHPRTVWVNWNGDVWEKNLTHPDMLDLLRYVDLQLVVNASVIPFYEQRNIAAFYWQVAYENVIEPYPEAPAHDVVFLGTNYNPGREALLNTLKPMMPEFKIGLYGAGWEHYGQGNTTYNFPLGAALYHHARLALGDNQHPNGYGFVSNRIFQALAAGGSLLLHQRVPGLYELTGLMPGEHYIEWQTLDELPRLIRYWLDPEHEEDRKRIAAQGTTFVREHHSFDIRVKELFGEHGLIKKARRTPNRYVAMRFTGTLPHGGQVGPVTRTAYEFTQGKLTMIDQLDVPQLEATGVWVRA